jgi:uncharacterized protein (TIGR02266 family)
VAVETPHGVRGYGVIVATTDRRWRARIITFPNIMWMIPGGGESLKILARTEDEAVRLAVDFIRRHCVTKGYLMRDEVQFVESMQGHHAVEGRPRVSQGAPRFARRLPVRYGRSRPTIQAYTLNLSETGLFVTTDTPLAQGELLGLSLELEHCKLPLRGSVAWHRSSRDQGRDRGMGLALVTPPDTYIQYVRALS